MSELSPIAFLLETAMAAYAELRKEFQQLTDENERLRAWINKATDRFEYQSVAEELTDTSALVEEARALLEKSE